MIELTDTIRAVEEFITTGEHAGSDHCIPAVQGGGYQGENSLVLVRSTKDQDGTHSFGGMSVNVD